MTGSWLTSRSYISMRVLSSSLDFTRIPRSRVLAIPFKRTNSRLVPYLAQDEVQALLDIPDPATREGIRDRAMLHLAICNGLRVSELTGLCIADITLTSKTIRVLGKGRRERILPLWKATTTALRACLLYTSRCV